ncbi:carboxyl transferase domain-containing protein [Lactiplantibacillus plantarum]
MNTFLSRVRDIDRFSAEQAAEQLFDSFVKLSGDRATGVDSALVSGIGLLGHKPVTFLGIERTNINGGSLTPCGYRTCLRLIEQAEKWNRPVLTFVNTPGAYCDLEAERFGQAQIISELISKMTSISVPVISLLMGEGGSGGALALMVANYIIATNNSMFATISPEGYSTILNGKKTSNFISQSIEELHCKSNELKKFKIVDEIIPDIGSKEPKKVQDLKEKLIHLFKGMCNKKTSEIVAEREKKIEKAMILYFKETTNV